MKRRKLKDALLEHINSLEGWIPKVDLYVVGDRYEYSPETVGRCLRKLAEDKEILVDTYDGKWAKGLARYARTGTQKMKHPALKEVIKEDGSRVMIMM